MGDGYYYTGKEEERAVLVAIITQQQPEEKVKEYLDELEFLATTAGVTTIAKFVQRLDTADQRTFVGKGKLDEIKEYVDENDIDMIIFDDELSPSQVRNIEKQFKKKRVIDRSLLILDIFNIRAKTARARTQVELARSEYILPRLTRMWSHLERQRGGTGTRGGSGEKELETDRRIIRDRISLLKKELDKIDKQMRTQRKSRGQQVRVSLVGYTNVGKSTIMNLLSKSEVFAENKLFATLDSTVRKVVINTLPFLLSDTVGFIRKLPHTLVECFKSTLDEIVEADVLLHVIDVSHPSFEDHYEVVNRTLGEIGANDKKTILVFNKIDQYTGDIDELRKAYEEEYEGRLVFVSAFKKINVDEMKDVMFQNVKERFMQIYPNYVMPQMYQYYESPEGEQ